VATTADEVRAILLDSYGAQRDGTLPSLDPFMASASAIMLRVRACAQKKGQPLTAEEADLIHTWLSAHLYAMSDQQVSQKTINTTKDVYSPKTGMRLEATTFGQTAMVLDPSGCLSAMNSMKKTASVDWGGKSESEQTHYYDRD
jgi:hypothetical protein